MLVQMIYHGADKLQMFIICLYGIVLSHPIHSGTDHINQIGLLMGQIHAKSGSTWILKGLNLVPE